MAVLYLHTGQYEEADPLFQRAISLTEQTMGKSHFRVERALRNYAQLLRKMDRTEEALSQESRADDILAKNTLSPPTSESGSEK